MLIDDRLRAALDWNPGNAPPPEPDLLDSIAGRATRRRRIRVATIGITAAVAAAVITVGGPWAISRSERGGEPVRPPNQSSWTPQSIGATPIDQHWVSSNGSESRAHRLAALDGTGLQQYGPEIYAGYIANTTTDLQFGDGDVDLSTSVVGSGTKGLGLGDHKASLHGTYTVRGDTVAMRFEEVSGTTTFRWRLVDDRGSQRLALTFIGTTSRTLYAAPAEVFFRLWSVRPFYLWG
jgi:hypothetical protein